MNERPSVPFGCLDCPAFGTEMCSLLEQLGFYCDVKLAASEAVARAVRQRRVRKHARLVSVGIRRPVESDAKDHRIRGAIGAAVRPRVPLPR